MKIFVTGASGFIGRAFCEQSMDHGFELLCLDRTGHVSLPENCQVAQGSLDNLPWDRIEKFQPEALLHLAWEATPGEYLNSTNNESLVTQSQQMIDGLVERGVTHVAAAGTCIEYAASNGPLHEFESPPGPAFPYSIAKFQLFDWLKDRFADSEITWSWLRIFYPYGVGEHPNKLTTAFARKLAGGEAITLKTPHSTKDFIYITDLAEALCAALDSKITGPVNLGTGTGTSIRGIAKILANQLQAPTSLVQDADELGVDPTPLVIADVDRILSTGWKPKTSIERGLEQLIASLE